MAAVDNIKIMDDGPFGMRLKEETDYVEGVLIKFLPKGLTHQKTVGDAMEYSLMAGGKRLRPILMLEAYRLFGGKNKGTVEPFMAAMEMIHTYSLVHDDLPAMDNDDYRRGRKTTHVVYGEDMAILAGDALLNRAYETAISSMGDGVCVGQKARAASILSKKAGIYGMIGGQTADVEATGKKPSDEVLKFIYELKTSALIEASLMAGAALAGASDGNVADMEKVGRDIGMAFQIRDDILDVSGDFAQTGKPVRSDEKNDKYTYVSAYGLDGAAAAVEEYSDKALKTLVGLPCQNEFLNALVLTLVKRTR